MSVDELKDLLSEMADDVKQTPVHQQAIAKSHRASRHRAILASVLALVMTGAGIATAAQFRGDDAAVPADFPEPLPTGDTDTIAGTFYMSVFTQGQTDELFDWRPDQADATKLDGDPNWLVDDTGAVSPDGEYLAYLTTDEAGAETPSDANKIRVLNLETGDTEELGEFSGFDDICSAPTWSPDNRLFVDRGGDFGDERLGFFDPESGDFTPSAQTHPCDIKVAMTNEDLLYSTVEQDGRVEVTVTDLAGNAEVSPIGEVLEKQGEYVRELVAVSPDGRFACVNTNTVSGDYFTVATDRFNSCTVIIEVDTGRIIDVGFDADYGWQATPAVFTVPGRLLFQIETASGLTWTLTDFEGEQLDTVETEFPFDPEDVSLGFLPDPQ